ncbi:MAG: ATP-binding cassette domain-containing protein, partial [Lactobacillus johnsonii]|nr:ATP-binding cassette domain-containing protein [Lactobacillus johnsonii]
PTTPQENQLSSFTWNKDSTFIANNVSFNYSHIDQDHFSVNKNAKMSAVVKKEQASTDKTHTADELRNVNLNLTGFQKVGIIGPTGAGKTTLMRILAGFLTPHLKEDNFTINGQNLAQLNQKNWQNQITYIPQDPFMFATSIKENLTFYNPSASQTEIDAALKATNLNNFVASLKDGLNTRIGENGRGISGGQKQRIALARAFLAKDRKVLFFDEPTAHLDIETEYELKEPMKKLMENHLVFFTTHRLHWLNDMDWCLVIEDGEIVEQGAPSDLAKNGTLFKKLTQPLKEDLL